MRSSLLMSLVALVAVALSGVLHDPYGRRGTETLLPPALPLPAVLRSAPAHTSTTAATRTTTTPSGFARSAYPGAPGSARYVAYRFGLAYGNYSVAGSAQRALTLTTLSMAGLAQRFRDSPSGPEYEATSGLPPGARMVAQVISILPISAQPRLERVDVTLQQALQQHDGATEQPLAINLDVELVRTGSDWRVASFTVAP